MNLTKNNLCVDEPPDHFISTYSFISSYIRRFINSAENVYIKKS